MDITADHKHNFRESTKKGYEVCIDCNTYHSIDQLPPDEIYVNKAYWGEDSGRSTLEQQISNMTCIDECGISKVDRVMQFVPDGEVALEIACAPGIMLKKLIERGYEAYGIEPRLDYVEQICKTAINAKVIHGYFPQVFNQGEHDLFDCIIGLDVAEHIEDYDGFFKSVNRLLNDGGTAIIMSPIILDKDRLIKDTDFIPAEHCWIFSQKYLEPYLNSIFGEVKFSRWLVGHELIILKKKSMYYQQGERFDMELCSDYGLKNDK